MTGGSLALLIILLILLGFVATTAAKSVKIVRQQSAIIIERLGRYSRTLEPGFHLLVPFFDRPRAVVDLREQVVSFPPQPVITSDNLVVSIDTVIYFQPTDPKSAVYAIANYIQGIEQLTVTTLRNVIGSLDLEQTLTSRDQINGQLRGVLDEATGRWGIRVNRVELKAIDPPHSVQDSMEKQMRAERDRRAAILNAEGVKQSNVLTAEGEKQAQILRAEGTAQSAILEAQGEARAILQVFDAVHRGNLDSKVLAYQYLQTLPKIAEGSASKVWMIPSELGEAVKQVGAAFAGQSGMPGGNGGHNEEPDHWVQPPEVAAEADLLAQPTLQDPTEALRQARQEATDATNEAANSENRARPRGLTKNDAAELGAGAPATQSANQQPNPPGTQPEQPAQ